MLKLSFWLSNFQWDLLKEGIIRMIITFSDYIS